MNSRPRLTNYILGIIALLLAVRLLVGGPLLPNATAQSSLSVRDVIRARQIDLVGANGQVVAQIYTGDDGSGNIRLRSASGEVRVKLGAMADGAGLILMNGNTEPAASLSSSPGQVALKLVEPAKGTRIIAP